MPVFISHKNTDSREAIIINEYLKSRGISTYLDVMDLESQSTDDITSLITSRIKNSTHLIAVVSQNTQSSWWVPFEIGEATYGLRRICSYKLSNVYNLPEYLEKWPIMSSHSHLRFFCNQYLTDTNTSKQLNENLSKYPMTTSNKRDEFHKSMKLGIATESFF